MVDYHYDDNVPKSVARRSRLRLALISLSVLIVLIIGFVVYDSLRSKPNVAQVAPATSTLGSQTERQVFNEPEFRFTADTTWEKLPPVDDSYNAYRYQSSSDGLARRQLTIYVNNLPKKYAVPYVLPVEVNGNKITPLATSPKCSEIQPVKSNRNDVELSWAGVEFLCDPDGTAPEVATSHNKMGYNLRITGESGATNTYFFVFRDSQSSPNLQTFGELLRTFEAK